MRARTESSVAARMSPASTGSAAPFVAGAAAPLAVPITLVLRCAQLGPSSSFATSATSSPN